MGLRHTHLESFRNIAQCMTYRTFFIGRLQCELSPPTPPPPTTHRKFKENIIQFGAVGEYFARNLKKKPNRI